MAAALDGIERGLDPGDPVDQDPGNLSDAERERRGIRRFPETAAEALDELEADAGPDGRPGRAIGRRIPQGPTRRGRRVRRAGRGVRARTALLQVLIGRGAGCPSTSTSIPIVDNHCHSLLREQPPDDEAFRIHLTESYFPEVARDDVPHSLFYQLDASGSWPGCSTATRRPTPSTPRVASAGSSG